MKILAWTNPMRKKVQQGSKGKKKLVNFKRKKKKKPMKKKGS